MLIYLHTSVDVLLNQHREVSQNDEQLSKALSLLASCEENTALARSISKLSETHENLSITERHKSEQDLQQLAEPLHVFNFIIQILYLVYIS